MVSEIIREFRELDLIGYPRLVRLNPNIPWKTRGNGAVCIRLGKGTGEKTPIGEIDGAPLLSFESGEEEPVPDAVERMEGIIESHAHFYEEKTNPAFAVLKKRPDPSLYWKAVRSLVRLEEVEEIASTLGECRKYKNGRGLIGACSAISWSPEDRTYEVITYREPPRWGTPREISVDSVKEMDRRTARTFNNYDYVNERVTIAPNSPCPVLFGIRGDSPAELIEAMRMLDTEPVHRWNLFLTNQGTDDHLSEASILGIQAHESVILRGKVSREPRDLAGGHVVFEIGCEEKVECTAYEPTKQFRDVIRDLRQGDEVRVYGSVREQPRTINLEKMEVLSLTPKLEKTANPKCPSCGKSMKSIGKSSGYRCRRCGSRAEEDAATVSEVERGIEIGFYEPPVCARRHLSKPLSRMGVQANELRHP